MPLKEVFEGFKRSKARLQSIHEKTIECFDEIERKLSDTHDAAIAGELIQASSPTKTEPEDSVVRSLDDVQLSDRQSLTEELYTAKEREQVRSLLLQEPALIVVGQTNCGKSSIINELLGDELLKLPTSDRPSTARIVRVTYGETPRLKIQTKDGKIINECDLTGKKKIPRKYIELHRRDRQDTEAVQATAIIELDNEFLKAGVDVIDSPGRNENDALDNLVKQQLENSLPLIIYVVDGHNLFTTQDREVLSEIITARQELEIFYVVSKLEPEDRECSDDDEEPSPSAVHAVHSSKKKRVYERLVRNGFLSKSSGSMEQHERFHGLSAWKIREYNQQKKKLNGNDPGGPLNEYKEAFDRFQSCLQAFAEGCLRAKVEQVCRVLINVLSRCLDFFIQKANVFKERREYISNLMEKVISEEGDLNEKITADLDGRAAEIEEAVSDTFSDVRGDVLKEARAFEYNMDEVIMPKEKFVYSSEVIENFRQQLATMVTGKLQEEMHCKLAMLFQSRDHIVVELTKSIEKIEEEVSTDGFVPAAVNVLTKSLVSNYNNSLTLPSSLTDGRVRRFFGKLFSWWSSYIRSFLRKPISTLGSTFKRGYHKVRSEVEVTSPEWKEGVASGLLDAIDPSKLAVEIVEQLKVHLQECHKDFSDDMENIRNLLKRGETVKDGQRKKILEFAPRLAKQEMLAYSVMDRFKFGLPKKGELVGIGAQGQVHVCDNITTPKGNTCVVKTVQVLMNELLEDLTVELHNTRSLHHPNILPLVCAIVDENDDEEIEAVSLVSERMRCDLEKVLPSILSLRSRLVITLDVARALQYLHQANLMHRDVKLQNILLDDENRAKLTDFGLCKPEGLVTNTLVGTAPYMAPEMLEKYSKSVDVYAFGMVLWRVCEGKGNDPKNVHQSAWPIVMLHRNAEDPRIPERLDTFPQSCWELMEKCWELESEKRPSFDSIVRDLEEVLRDPNIV